LKRKTGKEKNENLGKIVPTIFSLNKKKFERRFEKIVKISNKIQIDFIDGKFVPNKSLGLKEIPDLKKYKKLLKHI